MRQQLDLDAGLHLLPVFLLQQRLLVAAQWRLGRADQVVRLAGTQKLQVLLADHPPVHHPHPFGLAVFSFHRRDDVLDGGHIGAVAREHFVAHRQTFGSHHQSNADLFAVAPMVAAVAPCRQFVVLGQSLEGGAGNIVEQKFEAHPEPIPVALQQLRAQRLLVRQQLVQPAIQPRIVDLLQRHAQQILQRRVVIPALGQRQFARLGAKPTQRQHTGDLIPADVLLPGRQERLKQRVQAQPPPQRQPQVDASELAQPLHPHPGQVHLAPPLCRRLRGAVQLQLRDWRTALQQRIQILPAAGDRDLGPVEFAQPGDHLLPRSTRRAHRLHQRPVFVGFATGVPTMSSQEHAQSIAPPPALRQ